MKLVGLKWPVLFFFMKFLEIYHASITKISALMNVSGHQAHVLAAVRPYKPV